MIFVFVICLFFQWIEHLILFFKFQLQLLNLFFESVLLLFILGIFFLFFVFIVMVSLCWRKIFGPRQSWKDLSETDSSVSWVSINTTTTEDTPVKPASQPQHVSTVKTVLQTDILAPISEQKILMVPGEFVLDRGTQWCRTEISPSIIV